MAKILRGLDGREYPVALQPDFMLHNRFGDGTRSPSRRTTPRDW
jgi:hypothetical protein